MSAESQGSRTIICLENGTDVFDRVSRILASHPHPGSRLVHWTKVPPAVVDLLHEFSPGVLVVTGGFLKPLFMRRFANPHSSDYIRILAVTDMMDAAGYELFLRNGCHGVIGVDSSDHILWKSVESLFAGELWIPRAVLSQIVRKWLRKNQPNLTSREEEILELITSGLKNQEIADRLFISRETVRWHIRGLYSKVGIRPRPRPDKHSTQG